MFIRQRDTYNFRFALVLVARASGTCSLPRSLYWDMLRSWVASHTCPTLLLVLQATYTLTFQFKKYLIYWNTTVIATSPTILTLSLGRVSFIRWNSCSSEVGASPVPASAPLLPISNTPASSASSPVSMYSSPRLSASRAPASMLELLARLLLILSQQVS